METNQERKVDRLYVGWTDKQKEREREKNRPHGHTPPTRLRPLSGEAPKKKAKKRKRRKEKEKKKKKKKHGFLPYLHARQENAGRAVASRGFFSLRCGGVGW